MKVQIMLVVVMLVASLFVSTTLGQYWNRGGGGMYSRMGGFSRSFGGSSGGGNRNFARWYGR
ncbi:Hypothetical predicted protein [Mytilus galloprovincialis]|uniref:Uncharacterized protein n=1 Tax=Mytilus galloprovincialis TaxID=29158 RepID=A0A8B6EFK2_MYTGA|nr:Hypothetical predicted protein [Mytilus galloprovincialis]